MSDQTCMLAPSWVFLPHDDVRTCVKQVGSERDFWMRHWSLFCANQRLRFWRSCSVLHSLWDCLWDMRGTASLSTCLHEGSCFFFSSPSNFEGWRHIHAFAFILGKIDSLFPSLLDVLESETVEFLPKSAAKEDSVSYCLFFLRVVNCIAAHDKTMIPLAYQRVDRLTLSFICINQQTRYLWL